MPIIIGILLTGCNTETMKSPEKLIEKPISNKNHAEIYNDIKKLTPLETNFILPKNILEASKVNVLDLDADGVKEVVAFKKKLNDTQGVSNIYMYLFKLDNNSVIDDSEKIVRIPGDLIKYANFIDIDGDGKKEIIIQVVNRGFENIYVYKYENDTLRKVTEYNTTNLSIMLNFYDYEKNGKQICLALVQDLSTFEVKICKMSISEENGIKFDEFDISKNVESIDRIEVTNGKVSNDEYGTIVSYLNLNGSVVYQIVVYKDGKFVRVLDENESRLKSPYNTKPAYIENGKILNIPKAEFKFSNNTLKESNVLSWYQWNGSFEGGADRLQKTAQIYYNYDYNFKIKIPNEIIDKVFIEQKYDENKSYFDIKARNSENKMEKLYSIEVIVKDSDEIDSDANKALNSNVLYQNENYIYILSTSSLSNLKKYNISYSIAKDSFEPINK